MKRLVPLLLLGLALAVIAASFARRGCCDANLAKSAAAGDTACWFRCEFGLDSSTSEAVTKAHAAFMPECEKHCARIAEARAALGELPADAPADRRADATRAVAEAVSTCEAAREAHARKLAAMMPPVAGKRYLDLVLPRLRELDHNGAPDASGRR